jgi:predicted anti-sigma-YlaC factor YlaD
MMTCGEARDALLAADLTELDGSRESPLAAHLAHCPACRAAAERVLMVTHGLQAERAVGPRWSAGAAAARARAEARRLRRARRARWAFVPVLAAAGLAIILLARGGGVPSQPVSYGPAPAPPLVESAAANVAVFTTDNPTIVVVWQF